MPRYFSGRVKQRELPFPRGRGHGPRAAPRSRRAAPAITAADGRKPRLMNPRVVGLAWRSRMAIRLRNPCRSSTLGQKRGLILLDYWKKSGTESSCFSRHLRIGVKAVTDAKVRSRRLGNIPLGPGLIEDAPPFLGFPDVDVPAPGPGKTVPGRTYVEVRRKTQT